LEVSRDWARPKLERGAPEAEDLRPFRAVDDHEQVSQPIAGGHEVERLVYELDAARGPGQEARQLCEGAV
jgi:hypothetical protein